jgi:hypothetical protein
MNEEFYFKISANLHRTTQFYNTEYRTSLENGVYMKIISIVTIEIDNTIAP